MPNSPLALRATAPGIIIATVVQHLEALAFVLYEIPPSLLSENLKIYPLVGVLKIAFQSVIRGLVFPATTVRFFWLTNDGHIRLADTADPAVEAEAGQEASNWAMPWAVGRLIHRIGCTTQEDVQGATSSGNDPGTTETAFIELPEEQPTISDPPSLDAEEEQGEENSSRKETNFLFENVPQTDPLDGEPVDKETGHDPEVERLLHRLIRGPDPKQAIVEAYRLFKTK